MATTSVYGLRYPVLADAPNGPAAVQNLAEDVEAALRKPVFSATQTVAQSIANGAYVPVTFTMEILDSHNGHSTSTNTSRYVAQLAGYYRVSGAINISGSGGNRACAIFKNGALYPGSQVFLPAAAVGDTYVPCCPRLVILAVGDYVEIIAYQDSGGAKNTFAGTGYACAMDVEFVRRA